jgi:hypothetical protein
MRLKTFVLSWLLSIILVATTGCEILKPISRPISPQPTPVIPVVVTPAEVQNHPRLWIRQEDLPRLRALVNDGNPYYRDGLALLVESAKQNMDEGRVPGEDSGSAAWEEYPTEEYALLFAFMSLIHPEAAERDVYAARARALLMHVINQAARGPAEGKAFRDPSFSWNDRSRWNGRSFGLTVDWIYPYLSADDKAAIHKVFLRWSEEIRLEGRFHPEPTGRLNDPAMLADKTLLRWSLNNYFTAGMRNMGYMALALDPVDDPGNQLHDSLKDAIGARLYLLDNMLYTDARGGLSPEGFQYAPQALGYAAEFLLALYTAGEDDPAKWGNQVTSLAANPFWDDTIPAFLHSISPTATTLPGDLSYLGEVYQPAWMGAAENYWAPDMIQIYGPLGIYDQLTGNPQQLESLRWVETHTPPGGKERLISQRIGGSDSFGTAIEYFLLFDPSAAEPADPRPSLPLDYFAEGTGRLLVRTSWEPDATWFDYGLGWNTISHQLMDGNTFEFQRKGEWLTKRRVGYDFDYAASDNQNTLAIQNDKPERAQDDYRTSLWERGSQWPYNDKEPKILNKIVTERYVYVTGDATCLYNWDDEQLSSVLQAVRSILWIKGSGAANDVIVVYDRAATARPEQFKRFWLNLPAELKLQGQGGVMVTDSGQQLFVNSLLPLNGHLSTNPAANEASDEPAKGEPMRYKLMIETGSPSQEVQFLTVLQGADSGASAYPVALVESKSGDAYQGAVVGKTAILFPLQVNETFKKVIYQVPGEVTWQFITGLQPNEGYDITVERTGENLQIIIQPGTTYKANAAGVISLEV